MSQFRNETITLSKSVVMDIIKERIRNGQKHISYDMIINKLLEHSDCPMVFKQLNFRQRQDWIKKIINHMAKSHVCFEYPIANLRSPNVVKG